MRDKYKVWFGKDPGLPCYSRGVTFCSQQGNHWVVRMIQLTMVLLVMAPRCHCNRDELMILDTLNTRRDVHGGNGLVDD